ncbi:MAG: glycolate oxidase binding subunit [Micromonosporaceae bacterium]|jgi:glycolate oxidase FAD binding subunit|nr:glycolate oxidase binding subunit [Micromonosporaceae bacterium]MDT5038684.1 glycolate oxidase binding subunit [Micromonosporaceae bacterium]
MAGRRWVVTVVNVRARVAAVCGERFVRDGVPADALATVAPRWVAAPASTGQVSDLVAVAADADLAVAARGAGTKLDWGAAPSRLDLLVDMRRLAGIHTPAAAEPVGPVAVVGAGTPLRAAQAVLAITGQRIALDPASAAATVGGVLSTDEAGPLRLSLGRARDALAGLEFVRADGVAVRSAGRMVNDTFGSDVAGLLCGSLGTIGLVTAATLRLQPVPPARRWLLCPVGTPLEARDLTASILGTELAPAAIEVDLPKSGEGTLGVLFEGPVATVAAEVRAATGLFGPVTTAGEAPPWWGRYPFGGADAVALKLAAPVAGLHALLYALRDGAGLPVAVRASPGVGEAWAALPADLPVERVVAAVDAVRAALSGRPGSCSVLTAPPAVRASVDLWGDDRPGPAASGAVKQWLDPRGILSPGR